MSYLILSYHINHIGAEGISDLTWNESKLIEHFEEWKQVHQLDEMLYLATCNRVEFLFHSPNIDSLIENIGSLFSDDISSARIYSEESSIIQHLLDVSLSMDSLVFGENQILGQLKTAYRDSLKRKTSGTRISILVQNILKHAKKIRSQNHLSNIHNTISTVAAKDYLIHADANLPILLVGAGESNQLVARYLIKRGFRNFIWTNRTDSRSEEAASRLGGTFISWKSFLNAELPNTEAVFLTTNAGKVIFTEAHLKSSKAKRVYDLSIPANANADEIQSLGANYVGLDVLKLILDKEHERYLKLKKKIQKDIKDSANEILSNLSQRELDPIISESLENIDSIVSKAMDHLPTSLAKLSKEQKEALRLWTRTIVQKTKHEHIHQLKKVGNKK